jgi:hypothetical protein
LEKDWELCGGSGLTIVSTGAAEASFVWFLSVLYGGPADVGR